MKKNFIGLVIGILIMIFLLYRIGIENIVNLLLKIKLEYFIAALFVYFIVEIIAALILKIVIKGKFISILSSHMCGMILSAPTPGRLGYYYTAYSLSKKTKHSTSENIGYLTIIQGLSFLVKVFLCIIAIIYFSSFILPSLMNYFIIISVFPVLFFIGIILMLYTKLLNKILRKITLLSHLEKYIENMQKAVRTLTKKKILIILFLQFVGWSITGFQWLLVAKALNINIELPKTLMLQPLLTSIMFIPLTPSGIGVAESGSAILFNIIGFSSAIGVTFLLLQRLSTIIVDSFGLIDLRIHKIKLEKIKSKI